MRIDPGPPLWPQPPSPWAVGRGALALWCALLAMALVACARVVSDGWTAWGLAATAWFAMAVAVVLALATLLPCPSRQRWLAGGAVVVSVVAFALTRSG